MKENEVVESVKAWLKEIFPNHNVSDPSLGSHSDLTVRSKEKIPGIKDWRMLREILRVECKGTKFNYHRAVGQCLDYFYSGRMPTFLAIPEDSRHFKRIKQIIGFFNLPIGIIVVNSNREVRLIKGILPKTKLINKSPKKTINRLKI